MPTVTLEGLNVRFPYDPYEIQKNLMSCVIKCIENRQHGLLESPTGTGKTASLLCSALAWQQNDKEMCRRSLQGSAAAAAAALRGGPVNDPAAMAMLSMARVPKIIYATRTHSQISQCVKELKRTAYNKVRTVILGSRDLMCIHDEVSRYQESSTKIMACHMKVLGRTCAYYNNVQKFREQVTVGEQPVMDIEELVTKGRSHRFCPFFMSKEMVADADLIFMPYNYLLDPKLRTSHGVDLKGCVIILDEAHNITKVCEDSSSFELKSSTLAQCIREVTRCLNEYNELTEELKKNAKELSLGEIVKLKGTLLDLEKALDEAPFCLDIPSDGKTVEGAAVLNCFTSSGFTITEFGRWIRVLDGVSSFLATNYTEATGCDKFSGVLRVLNTRLLGLNRHIFLSSYAVRVELEQTKVHHGPQQDLTSWKKPKGKLFNFWCLNPAVGLDLLLQHSPRCIMLASGTLSPVKFIEDELQLHFPIKLQNPHIITDKQLYASILKVGPGNVKLSSAFSNRSKPEYMDSLGTVIREVCGVVPQGVLVFFPSYSAMDQAVEYWKHNDKWQEIGGEKSVYVEPRGKKALDDLIKGYYQDCERSFGSVLMAVCRGKVSEGLDFTDGKCRAVILTGLPYAPFKNEQVTGKMKYLDDKSKNSQAMRGKEWYSIDAVRALNQAVGRIIRHREDYGAILICDDRCDFNDVRQHLSGWVSNRLVRPSFSEMVTGLEAFFRKYGAQIYGGGATRGIYGYGSSQASQESFSGSQHAGGNSFEYNNATRSYSVRIKETITVEESAEVKFSELYDGGDFAEEIRVRDTSKKKVSALERLQEIGPACSKVIWSGAAVKVKAEDPRNKESASGSASVNTQPKKKIKLVGENRDATKYSRVLTGNDRMNPKYVGLPRCGQTINHVMSTAERRAQEEKETKKVFKPIFSSTPSPAKKKEEAESRSFKSAKDFGPWVKSKLSEGDYKKLFEEFRNYKQKPDVTKLLEFGKKVFPDAGDYKSYMNGLCLTVTPADRATINDVISSYDFEDCSASQY